MRCIICDAEASAQMRREDMVVSLCHEHSAITVFRKQKEDVMIRR